MYLIFLRTLLKPAGFVVLTLALLFLKPVYADTAAPAGFNADISRPVPDNAQSIDAISVNTSQKVTSEVRHAWQSYDAPVRQCIKGDTIIPAKNNPVLSFIFGTQPDANATLSIAGWKQNLCQIDFKVGTIVKHCRFKRSVLNMLMGRILNPDLFKPDSLFAQALASSCQQGS